MDIITAIGAAIGVAAPTGTIVWYKLGRIEQRIADLPCVDNGINFKCSGCNNKHE